jgi:peptidoglycan hydrolase CwlO-like protein
MKLGLPKIITSITLLLLLASPVFASLSDDLAQNQAKQDQLQAQINKSKNQENTLQNQISLVDNQIALAQLQVDEKQAELDGLTNSIGDLTAQIAKLEYNLNTLAKVSVARFRVEEAVRSASPLGAAFVSGNFAESSTNMSYQTYIEQKDKEVFKQMYDLKRELTVKKADLVSQQTQVAQVRDQLASAKADLDNQKTSKVQLLRVTQNNEAQYQRMLVAARKEAEQITLAYNNKSGSRWVRRGEPVGTEGCSGYCFGAHLHFALYPGYIGSSNSLNPCAVLSCDVRGDTGYVRSGRYSLPLHWSGSDYADVSQWWGMTWFARAPYYGYGGGPHTGIDMYTYQGDIIRAANDGQAYFYRGGQTNGNGVFIYHSDGYVTLYWHLN